MRLPTLYHEADSDADPQGGRSRASDMLEQYGRDALRLAEKLADVQSDNYRLREERRNLKQQIQDAASKAPAEGARVLSKEDAVLFDAYAALGTPDAIKQAMDVNGEATAKLARLEREKLLTKAADAAGFKAAVLQTLAADLDIQVKEKDKKPFPVVITDGKEVDLSDYAAQHWGDFLPALKQQSTVLNINATARNSGAFPVDNDAELARKRRDPLYS